VPQRALRAGTLDALRALLIAAAALLVTACATVPPGADFPKESSRALENPGQTKLGRLTEQWSREHGGQSGFRLLPASIDSFTLRAEMIDAAEKTLDVQYYILKDDETGRLFTQRLLVAADRGVRVRLLLDDSNTIGGDAKIVALSAHPDIEVRLFNPFRLRDPLASLRGTELVLDADRLNRRMHNKLLIVDNAIAVAGGRNIGDEYFAANRSFEFGDFDAFVAGPPAVRSLSRSFDAYWNAALSVPAEAVGRVTPEALDSYRALLDQHRQKMASSDYEQAANRGNPLSAIVAGTLPLSFARAQVLYDAPDKALPDAIVEGRRLLREHLLEACRAAQRELVIVSPYLVPGQDQMQMLRELRQRGVRVRILTNSLASTDVPVVHAGYRKVREPLVRMGVELFEVKPQLERPQVGRTTLVREPIEHFSLHAKAFIIDGQRVFLGSANFDMRSFHLNTEVGLLIDSPTLARQALARFDAITIPANSYVVKLTERLGDPAIAWVTETDGRMVTLTQEPGHAFLRELLVGAVSILPIDGLL
jgi:putative cardiolipin synthase